MQISELYLYSEPRCPSVDFAEIAVYLGKISPDVDVCLRGPFLEDQVDDFQSRNIRVGDNRLEALAYSLAASKVKDIAKPVPAGQKVLAGEAAYELRRLRNQAGNVFGIMYDAHLMAGVCGSLLNRKESGIDRLHVIFTNQLIGTWDAADRRYHARTVLCGAPSIVSLGGITVAPAREPGFYFARRGAEALGFAEEEKMALAEGFAGDYLTLDDSRLTEVAKGYAAQVIAYRLSGEEFCEDPDCRIYNAHWQREVIRSQLGGGYEFCPRHAAMFASQARIG